jgi:hypothetical protein
MRAGKPVQLFQRVAKPALWGVIDPLKRQIVGRLGDDAQIGQSIADFGALIEPEAANDAIGKADGNKPVFDSRVWNCARTRMAILSSGRPRGSAFRFPRPRRAFGRVPPRRSRGLVAAGRLCPQLLAKTLAVFLMSAAGRAKDMRVER